MSRQRIVEPDLNDIINLVESGTVSVPRGNTLCDHCRFHAIVLIQNYVALCAYHLAKEMSK